MRATGFAAFRKGQSILTVEEWEAVVDEFDRRRAGVEFTGDKTRKHLLSGLLRCARPRGDGTPCSKPLIGTNRTNQSGGAKVPIYKCPGPVHGGCGGTSNRTRMR